MEEAHHSAQGNHSKETNEQRNLNLVKGVMVNVVVILPAGPVDTGMREEGNSGQQGKDNW